MLHTNARFAQAVEQVVGEIEARTDVEVVVVAAPQSGSYADISVLGGLVAAWAGLAFALWSPIHLQGTWLPLELPLLGLLAGWLLKRSPGLLRRLIPHARAQAQVLEAARAAFTEDVVYGTKRRTGLLVYVSALEDRVVLLADGGVEAHIPWGALNAVRWGPSADRQAPGDLDHFLDGLRQLGVVLAKGLPAVAGDNPNEISDAPRIRP